MGSDAPPPTDLAVAVQSSDPDVPTLWLRADPADVGTVRSHLRDTLLACGIDTETRDWAELLVSELATNVVVHTASERLGVRIDVEAHRVTVHVYEHTASGAPTHLTSIAATAPSEATHGRGLAIVDAVATEWGIRRAQRLTDTWFSLIPQTSSVLAPTDGRRRRDEQLDSRAALLLQLTRGLESARDPAQVASLVTATIRDHVDAVFVGLAMRDGDAMRYVSLDPLPSATEQDWQQVPLERRSPLTAAVTDGLPTFYGSVDEADADFPGIGEHMITAGTQAIAHLPMTSRGVAFGTLSLAWSTPRRIDPELRALLLIVAGYAAQALDGR